MQMTCQFPGENKLGEITQSSHTLLYTIYYNLNDCFI